MRILPISVLAVLSISAGAFAASTGASAGATATPALRTTRPPTCEELAEKREQLVHESASITTSVDAKNTELGEAADALKVAKSEARKVELNRRVEGLRRDLSDLENKEHASVDGLGALDSEIAKSCKPKGARK